MSALANATEARSEPGWYVRARAIVDECVRIARSEPEPAPAMLEALDELQRVFDGDLRRGRRCLEVAAEGQWFAAPGSNRVELVTRGALQRLLAALVREWQRRPARPLSVEELREAGWPGEKMAVESGQRRVYSTIHRLRQLGLKGWLRRHADGYQLDPSAAIRVHAVRPYSIGTCSNQKTMALEAAT